MTMSDEMAWSLLGKHPSRADFLKVNAGTEVAVEFHRFLEAGVEVLHRLRQPLALGPTRFLFAPKGADSALVGVLRPSVDSAGRQFPLAAFLEYPLTALPTAVETTPFFAAEAVDGAERLLAERATSTAPLDDELEALPLPGANSRAEARRRCDEVLEVVKVGALQALFVDGPAVGVGWYAVKTVLTACEARRKGAVEAPTLECRLSEAFGPAAWLSLASKGGLGGPPPTMLWSASRLYVAMGPPQAAIFTGLVGGEVRSTRVWPTGTSQQSAVDAARAALRSSPLLANPEAPWLEVLAGLGGAKR